MDNQPLTKEFIQELLKAEGKVKGTVFQTDRDYVLQEQGPDGLEKVKKRAKELECDIPYETADAMRWYHLGLRVASLLIIRDVFKWPDSKIFDMGYTAPKNSFIVRVMMRWFINFKTFIEKIPEMWKKHYTIAELEVVSADIGKKEDTLRLKGIKIHPILCVYLTGYFLRMHRYVLGPKVTNEHTKCMFRGDATCDFKHEIK
jgi:hypothetical protein